MAPIQRSLTGRGPYMCWREGLPTQESENEKHACLTCMQTSALCLTAVIAALDASTQLGEFAAAAVTAIELQQQDTYVSAETSAVQAVRMQSCLCLHTVDEYWESCQHSVACRLVLRTEACYCSAFQLRCLVCSSGRVILTGFCKHSVALVAHSS